MSRARWSRSVAGLCLLCANLIGSAYANGAGPHATAATALPPIVATGAGPVSGFVASYAASKSTAAFTTLNFLGIPYAAPPLGARRWAPPAPPASWTAPLAATKYGPFCPQGFSQLAISGGSEDCLTINVQTPPDATAHSKLPVLFWIHGGGLQTGSGQEYDGAAYVHEGHVVFVDFNYRLGLLGFFSHPALAAESSRHKSGNYGILDQQMALAWVRSNIANFGGDPNNITIMGESAGGVSVISQLISPLAPKFKGAVIQSGGYEMTFATEAADEAAGTATAKALDCADGAGVLTCLRAVPADTLVKTVSDGKTAGNDGPIVDGWVFTEQPPQAFAAGHFARVPLMNGTTHDEDRLLVLETEVENLLSGIAGPLHTAAGYPAELADTPGALTVYPLSNYPSADYAFAAYRTDKIMSCPAYVIDALASQYVPVYAYEFADPHWPNGLIPPDPYMTDAGDPHGSELTYLYPYFRTIVLNFPPPSTLFNASQQQLAATMRAQWLNFAKYGRPLAARSGPWPKYDARIGAVQSLVPPAPRQSTGYNAFHHCSGYWVPVLLNWYGLPAGSVQ